MIAYFYLFLAVVFGTISNSFANIANGFTKITLINNFKRKYQVDSVNVRFNESDTELLKVSRHLPGEVMDLVTGLYREFVLDRMSYLHRSTALWMNNVFEEGEDGPVYVAVAYDSDEPKAYVAYTLRAGKVNDRARPQEIKILDKKYL